MQRQCGGTRSARQELQLGAKPAQTARLSYLLACPAIVQEPRPKQPASLCILWSLEPLEPVLVPQATSEGSGWLPEGIGIAPAGCSGIIGLAACWQVAVNRRLPRLRRRSNETTPHPLYAFRSRAPIARVCFQRSLSSSQLSNVLCTRIDY